MAPAPRLRSDFWVSAYLRRCNGAGAAAVLRRRGAAEAGAIFIKLDRLDGTVTLFGPAPQSEADADGERRFAALHGDPWIDTAAAEAKLAREMRFDPDLWIVEVEDKLGRALV